MNNFGEIQLSGEKSEFGTASNHYISAICECAAQQGVDTDRLLKYVGLSSSIINKPTCRVKTEQLSLLQREVWRQLSDESSGLCGIRLKPGTYYMMGSLSVHQPTLEKALQKGCAFYNLLVTDDFVNMAFERDQVVIEVRLPFPEKDHKHLFAELTLLAWHRYASWLIANSIPLTEIRFPYASPTHVGEYSYLFPGVHRFDCRQLAIVFPASYLQYAVRQSEASLDSFMNNCPLELFRQYKSDYTLGSEIRRLLNKELSHGTTSIEDIAARLHLTSRTLMRRLKDEGTSFQQIKDLARRDKAIHLLTRRQVAINEIADYVGFSDPAAFTRAFRSWTGLSPRKYREYHRNTENTPG